MNDQYHYKWNKNIIYYGIDVHDENFLEKYCKT